MAGLRTVLQRVALLAAALVVVGVLLVFDPLAPLFGDEDEQVTPQRDRSEITVALLAGTVEAEGELVFTEQRDISTGGVGTLTAIASLGQSIDASTVLFEVDGGPTVALIGDVPVWRAMAVDDVGADVAQLEVNLVALGYDPDGDLSVDDTFTDFTAVVVERWQEDLGVDVTGSVAFGSIVFVPEQAQVTSVGGVVGQQASGPTVLSVSSTDRELVFAVMAEDLDTIEVGTAVTAQLPDRSTVKATVTEVGPSGGGSWSARAVPVALADGASLPDGVAVPVTVSWTELIADETTTVRANALTRLDTGAYVIEVVNADGSTTFVEVGIGAQSGSTVQIVTDLPAGTIVISP